jgi:RNA polymerase sigma factor (sigma-70 family)
MRASNHSDFHLLDRWREHRDAHAFKALTQRYGGLVFGICNRILRNPADAEEVTQDCFLKLACHPERPERSMGPWLHSTAVRAALNHRRAALRRHTRDDAFHAVSPSAVEPSIDDLLQYVDEAISLLPVDLQRCVVGCYLEDRPQSDVASELGVTTRTVRRKTDEAIARIRETLRQRGITSSAIALAAALSGMKAGALPPALAATLGKIGLGGAPQAAVGLFPASNGALTLGGILVMKKSIATAAVLLTILTVWWHFGQSAGTPSSDIGASVPVADFQPGPTSTAVEQTVPIAVTANLTDTTPPVSVAEAVAPVPFFDARPYTPSAIPNPTEYATVTGTVLDDEGRAIPRADILVLAAGYDIPDAYSHNELTNLSLQQHLDSTFSDTAHQFAATTNEHGEFAVRGIRFAGHAQVSASAPGFCLAWTKCTLVPGETAEADFQLTDGVALRGKVITPDKLPVADASVHSVAQSMRELFTTSFPQSPMKAFRARTDRNGKFTLACPEESIGMLLTLRVISDTLGENVFNMVAVDPDEYVTLILEAQRGTLVGQLSLHDGQVAAGYQMLLRGALECKFTDGESSSLSWCAGALLTTTTDESGRYRFENVPTMATYTANIFGPKAVQVAKVSLEPILPGETTTWDYTLNRPIRVHGNIRGATTEAGLSGTQVVYLLQSSPEEPAKDFGTVPADENGAYEMTLVAGGGTYAFRPAYGQENPSSGKTDLTQSMELSPGDDITLDFQLPEFWSQTFRVVDQFGQPVEGLTPNVYFKADWGGAASFKVEAPTDADGVVNVDTLPAEADVSFSFEMPGYIAPEDLEVRGEPGVVYPEETVVLYRATSIRALLTDTTGKNLAGLPVTCTANYGDGRRLSIDAQSDAAGEFLLEYSLPGTRVALEFEVKSQDGATLHGLASETELAVDTVNDLGTITFGVTAS